jgi:hypothetical protein
VSGKKWYSFAVTFRCIVSNLVPNRSNFLVVLPQVTRMLHPMLAAATPHLPLDPVRLLRFLPAANRRSPLSLFSYRPLLIAPLQSRYLRRLAPVQWATWTRICACFHAMNRDFASISFPEWSSRSGGADCPV